MGGKPSCVDAVPLRVRTFGFAAQREHGTICANRSRALIIGCRARRVVARDDASAMYAAYERRSAHEIRRRSDAVGRCSRRRRRLPRSDSRRTSSARDSTSALRWTRSTPASRSACRTVHRDSAGAKNWSDRFGPWRSPLFASCVSCLWIACVARSERCSPLSRCDRDVVATKHSVEPSIDSFREFCTTIHCRGFALRDYLKVYRLEVIESYNNRLRRRARQQCGNLPDFRHNRTVDRRGAMRK